MEHRLLQGDGSEIYLPFARSRIKALKALGMPYADQSFEVEGVSIKVRIQPGHEYIRIEGGSDTPLMDSGLVDLHALFTRPSINGQLYKSNENTAYEATFTETFHKVDSVRGIDQTWAANKKPGNSINTKLAGDITTALPFMGAVPPSGNDARSFERIFKSTDNGFVQLPEPTDPEDLGDRLFLKRYAASACPASMFTGKCRLYVQAMYGQHRYAYSKTGKATESPDIIGHGAAGGVRPYVTVRPFGYQKGGLEDVNITSSSGVVLDPATGAHWLVQLGSYAGALILYQLKGKHEKLRKYLKTGNTYGLNDDDKLHLEAYILAYCLPDVANQVTLPLAAGQYLPSDFGMGYGWHWNWSGTKADFVKISYAPINQGSQFASVASQSEHFRLTLTPPTPNNLNWSFTYDAPVTPTIFGAHRTHVGLLAPTWEGDGSFEKQTPPFALSMGHIFAVTVPIYAFYKGDELQLFTLKVESPAGQPTEVTMWPPSATIYQSPHPYSDSYLSIGTAAAFVQSLEATSGYVKASIALNGENLTGDIEYAKTRTGFRCDISEKTETGVLSPDLYPSGGVYLHTITHNDPDGSNEQSFSFYGHAHGGAGVEMNYTTSVRNIVEATTDRLIVLTPYLDAECVMYKGIKHSVVSGTDARVRGYNQYSFATWRQPQVYIEGVGFDEPGDIYRFYQGWGSGTGHGYMTSDTIESVLDAVEHSESAKINTGLSEEDMPFEHIPEDDQDPVDIVFPSMVFKSLSGASFKNPTVYAIGRYNNATDFPPSGFPAIVGWA